MVFFLFVVLYFLLACVLVWVALFPEGRAHAAGVFQSMGRAWQQAAQQGAAASRHTRLKVVYASQITAGIFDHRAQWISKHRWGLSLGLVLVILPPVCIFIFSTGVHLERFSDDRARTNPQVLALLNGEQLRPPIPLPPEIFVAADVVLALPMLPSASRNWQLLDADFAQRLLLAFKIMREKHGYDMAILEGYRSPERQDLLSRMGPQVTSAKAYQSYHQYGLAADSAFLRNGKLVISETDPWAMKGYALYGEVAESLGLTWGGRWKMMDFGHIEWRKPGVMK